ncbi:MAG TPA: NlpC/P60 family protein [Nocardioides sp.]|nr:NlpC/P60 family protein [uncultured Nocardioides sp.]HEX5987941.1 NlpC/P60 family protein [Nocardioides sp.]
MPQSLSPARPRAVRSVLVALATTATLAVTGLNGATAAAAEQPSSETAGQVVRKADRKNDQLERKHKKHARSALVSIRAFRVAAAQKGDPYRYGAAGPDAFDCSGLTSYAFRRAGKAIPRTSSAQRAAARPIPARAARPGDLVFFHGGGGVSHVGFYAGGHRILHSPYPGSSVKIERIWSRSVSYGRIG